MLGTLSHAPGGLGVFEATIIAAIGQTTARGHRGSRPLPPHLLCPPFRDRRCSASPASSCAAASFPDGRRARTPSASCARSCRTPRRRSHSPPGSSSCFPVRCLPTSRLRSLKQVVGLPLVETSHLVGSIVGVALLILARGLMRRLHVAWVATMALLAVGIVVSLAKGIARRRPLIMASRPPFSSPSGRPSTARAIFRSCARRPPGSRRCLPGWPRRSGSASSATGTSNMQRAVVAVRHQRQRAAVPAGNRRRLGDAGLGRRRDPHPPRCRRCGSGPTRLTTRSAASSPAAPHSQPNVALLGDKKFSSRGMPRIPDVRQVRAQLDLDGRSGGRSGGGGGPDLAAARACRPAGGRAVYYAVGSANLPTYLDMGFSVLKIAEVARVDLADFSL